MQNPQLPIFAFLSAILVLVPAIWHWRSRNVAIIAMIFWLSLADIINGVNTIVWAGNADNPIPVWCDMTTKFLVGASYALPLATLCICKHLEMVSSSRKVSYDVKDRKRRMIFEGFMCFGLPFIFMALHYIVQGHRYDIFENTGCQAAVYISIQAILIIWFPQLLFSVITLIYAALALHNFVRRRLVFAAHLQNSNSALTTNRYLRLIAMSLTQIVWSTSLTSFNLWNNVNGGLRPWTSWADVHSNFSRVGVFFAWEIPPQFISAMMLFWWSLPASSLIFFVFFGFGEEAVKEYKKLWTWFKTEILRRPVEDKKGPFGSFPSSRHLPKPLHLISLKTTASGSNLSSPSRDFQSKLPQTLTSNHLSQSSATLTPTSPYEAKKAKALEAEGDTASHYPNEPAPSYFPPTVPRSEQLDIPIDRTRDSRFPSSIITVSNIPRSPSLTDIDSSDTITVSTFSYYGGGPSTPTALLPSSPTLSNLLPETPIVVALPSLPPPPRRGPRHVGSNGSVNSAVSSVPAVPEDIGSGSYEGQRVLGVPGSGIMVTVQRAAQLEV